MERRRGYEAMTVLSAVCIVANLVALACIGVCN